MDKINRRCKFYCSFHPGQKDSAQNVALRTAELVRRGHHLISVHTNVAAGDVEQYKPVFADHGLELIIEKDQYQSEQYLGMKEQGPVICTYPRVYFGPSGKRYMCVAKLEDDDPTGLVDDQRFPVVMRCEKHGECRPCDVVVRHVKKAP